MRKMILYLLCFFIVGCTSKPSKEKNLQTPIDNTVGVNDTLGISLRPEFPVYSTSQKRIIFKLRNNGDANIGLADITITPIKTKTVRGGKYLWNLLYSMKNSCFFQIMSISMTQKCFSTLLVCTDFSCQ